MGLDGRRIEEIKTTSDGNSLAISLDTGDLKAMTPFFEIVAAESTEEPRQFAGGRSATNERSVVTLPR